MNNLELEQKLEKLTKDKAMKILEEQFKLLSESNLNCGPEFLSANIKSMLDIYFILFPHQYYQE